MGSIECIHSQAEGSREQPVLVPISEGIPQDILQSFRVKESQEDVQPLHLAVTNTVTYLKDITHFPRNS